ncbi:TPPC8 protein, partial [Polypterus senegalus]
MVAVLCSEDAEKVTRKNNLNFAELVRPFCRLTSEGYFSVFQVGNIGIGTDMLSCYEKHGQAESVMPSSQTLCYQEVAPQE